jgi:hypothetical protein
MGRPSRSTFMKREKERARFEKRQSKLARRQGGKAGGTPEPGSEGESSESESEESGDPVPEDADPA